MSDLRERGLRIFWLGRIELVAFHIQAYTMIAQLPKTEPADEKV